MMKVNAKYIEFNIKLHYMNDLCIISSSTIIAAIKKEIRNAINSENVEDI